MKYLLWIWLKRVRIREGLFRAANPNIRWILVFALGISNRRQSLACEAVHNHSIQQDTGEIARWVDWLHQKTGKPVILIGHSAGSLNLIAYLDAFRTSPVLKSVLISLVAFGQGPIAKEDLSEKRRAEADFALNENKIRRYRLAYCDNYSTTPGNYLTYLAWDQERTLRAITDMKQKPTIILGGEDKRLGKTWKPQLKSLNTPIIVIDGANHFFDHTYEFDLLDSIENALLGVITRIR
jgi:pimeloyl-ACP methyl ester carboxylesterase